MQTRAEARIEILKLVNSLSYSAEVIVAKAKALEEYVFELDQKKVEPKKASVKKVQENANTLG